MINIYVGNVPYEATETDLEECFKPFGEIISVKIIRDRQNSRSKGYGFVEMENEKKGQEAIKTLDGKELRGRPLKVNAAHSRNERRNTRRSGSAQRTRQPRSPKTTTSQQQVTSPNGKFYNPYTFVRTPSRPKDNFPGDYDPLENCLDHATLKDELWTGHIPIKITTVTPLVLLKDDGRDRKPSEHQTYDVHSRIPESSLRGMLRSAYEVVTNSRYSCFRNNDRLAYRMDTRIATKLIPTIIKKDKQTGQLMARLFTGSSHPTENGPRKAKKNGGTPKIEQIKEGAMYAALLPRYKKTKITYQSNKEPKTGDEIYAEIVLCGSGNYLYWQTSRIWLKNGCDTRPKPGSVPNSWNKKKPYKDSDGNHIVEVVEGTVLITNENIDRKGNERIFFFDKPNMDPQDIKLTDNHEKAWKELVKNYRDAHSDDDIFNRKDRDEDSKQPWDKFRKNSDTREYAWSPHLYHKSKQKDRWSREVHDAIQLQDGDMAYARCEIDDKTGTIRAVKDLFPVMISRELYENSPEDLLDSSLRPAEKLDELSPADRLFGWTPQEQSDDAGYKSRIRVVCENGECSTILENFENVPLPLTILGQPKPAQGRFYVAKDKKGNPQDDGLNKEEAGYSDRKGLRGRKHYWHHKGKTEHYWNPSVEEENKEYLRTKEEKDPQNRSVTGWIKPNTEFEASLYVQNLQCEEVGALLWLLSLPENCYHRLGYGKPLGFGSVKIEIDTKRLEDRCLPLSTGENWKTYYATLETSPPAELDKQKQEDCKNKFKDSLVKAYKPQQDNNATDDSEKEKGLSSLSMSKQLKRIQAKTPKGQAFDNLPFIKDFLRVLQGPVGDAPIHYPREKPVRDPEGKNYVWFMNNEGGNKRALPDVHDKDGLLYSP